MFFDPSNIQELATGIAAFIATITSIFLFFAAREERIARSMMVPIGLLALWGWFGFFYHIAPTLELARAFRVISIMGIVLFTTGIINFAAVYLGEKRAVKWWERWFRNSAFGFAVIMLLVLLGDLFGGRLVVGDLLLPPEEVLAPNAGPLLPIIIGYYLVAASAAAYTLWEILRIEKSKSLRRQSILVLGSMCAGLILACTRWTPWYGFDLIPVLGGMAVPLFIVACFYAITNYQLINTRVIATEVLIFVIWTFTFFRILLNETFADALPDIALFISILILGIFLIRDVLREVQTHVDRARSEFISIAAHQLRTPISGLYWTLNMLGETDQERLSAEQRKLIAKGTKASENLIKLVKDLLDVSRMSEAKFTYQFTEGDVRTVVRDSAEFFVEKAKSKQLHFEVRMDEHIDTTIMDGDKLALAMQNLIDNAIKYTPKGGDVTVSVEQPGDNKIHITVSDTGIGVQKDEQPRLFGKFFRSNKAQQMSTGGSGLGLFVVKTIVDNHGGAAYLAPRDGGGTNAVIILPVRHA